MQSTGFLDIEQRRPGAMVAVVAIHAAGIGALMIIAPTIVDHIPKTLIAKQIPLPKIIPEVVNDVTPKLKTKTILPVERVIPSKPNDNEKSLVTDHGPITGAGSDDGIVEAIDFPTIEPIKDPVIVGPRFVGRNAQPPYPSAMQRMSIEGAVTVRVLVGIDGRPLRIEAVRVDQEAFFNATRDWALKYWKFAPATRDGEPFQEWRTMTVRFEMD